MSQVVRTLGYSGSLQRLNWEYSQTAQVTAYLWGGGGGGGGSDGGYYGGNGSAGGYSTVNFTVSPGDVIDVAVGRFGGGGAGRASSAPGGSAGPSLLYQVFNTRTPPAQGPTVYPYTNGAWSSFMNSYAVWEANSSASVFTRVYSINFPITGWYYWRGQCDNSAIFTLDGNTVLTSSNFSGAYSQEYVYVTAGIHSVGLQGTNTGGPGGIALTIDLSYSGATGGRAGPAGSSGAGGGSGGASVLLLNNQVIAIAGGGAGGGGAGNRGPAQNASSTQGQASVSITNGQDGSNHPGDGGGGGAAGGGYGGGIGGFYGAGDVGGSAGSFGGGFGDFVAYSFNTVPPQTSNPYYFGSIAAGGTFGPNSGTNGTSGIAVFVFDVAGAFVRDGAAWNQINQAYIKHNNLWQPIKGTWIKRDGVWKPIINTVTPVFTTVPGSFGVLARPAN